MCFGVWFRVFNFWTTMKIKPPSILSKNWQLKLALWFLALIIIPSFLLAYFAGRALEAERLVYRQRVVASYERLARFATSEISQLIDAERQRWLENIAPRNLLALPGEEQERLLNQLLANDSLISDAYLVSSAGRVIYPLAGQIFYEQSSVALGRETVPELETWLLKFRQLTEQAEDLEFKENNPAGAIRIYQGIADTFPAPHLKAIALGEIARIYLFRAEWQIAHDYYGQIIENYPEARDLHNLHLRFYAKYQRVVTLDNMNRREEAMNALLELYRDLLNHSDEVNRTQYDFFVERIQEFFRRLITGFEGEKQQEYSTLYSRLQEQKKKNIGAKYLVEKLHQRLSRDIIERGTYRNRFKFLSDYAVEQPYLVAYILLSRTENQVVEAALGLEINLEQLKKQIFPRIMNEENYPEDVAIAVLDENRKIVLGGEENLLNRPAVLLPLRDPLNFWQLGVFPTAQNPLLQGGFRALYLKLGGIFLLWLFIIAGSAALLYHLRKQQLLSLQKSTFISSVTHELKTPLTSIRMFAEFLAKREGFQGDAEARKYLRILQAESERLARMVDNVLDYSKIERGVKKYQFEYEEAEAVVRTAVDAFRYYAETQGIDIQLDLPDSLGEVYIDRHAIIQALLNLLSNAAKYSPDKTPVAVSARESDGFLAIRVCDRGIGIEKKHLKHIFDDYYRVEDGKAAYVAGTGLGLALVKHVVEAHGGEVAVESEYGKGSTFTIKLPLKS